MNTYALRRGGDEEDVIARREAIVDIVSRQRIASQAELARWLHKRGFHATQATLSRDLRNLGIGKQPSEQGTHYVLPGPARDVVDARRQQIEISAFVQSVRLVGNLVIVRTPPGHAHGVARAIDLLGWTEVAGTLAGDDTILIVTEDKSTAQRFRRRLGETAGRSLS
jgi:transcriptional regulator of arginine metabolism